MFSLAEWEIMHSFIQSIMCKFKFPLPHSEYILRPWILTWILIYILVFFFICVLWQAKQYEQYSKEIKKVAHWSEGLAS